MIDIERRVDELCAAPAGCAFLLAIEASGLTVQEATEPVAAAFLAALAIEEVTPWFGGHDHVVAMALAEGPRLLPLAHDLLAEPAAAAWFAPLDRRAQQWVAPRDEGASIPTPARPQGPLSGWERYAQKAEWGLWTSTELDQEGAMTSFLASVAFGVADLGHSFAPPLVACRLAVAPAARVFEVAGPRDWHRLCTRYAADGEDGRLVSDWAAVAGDWDGVHLTLGGVLASEQVRVESEAGWSEHWAWDAEQTLWLGDVVTATVRLTDIVELAEPPDWLEAPGALRIEPGPDTWPWLAPLGPGTENDVDRPFPDDWPPLRLR